MQQQTTTELVYVGFWLRVLTFVVDSVLVVAVALPILLAVYGRDYLTPSLAGPRGPVDVLVNWIFPAAAVLLFWMYRSATPGKMMLRARIIDARTGAPPSRTQMVVRYLGYYVATLPLGMGLLWVAFDPRKQGWHDKLARTSVVRTRTVRAPVDASPAPHAVDGATADR